MSGQSTTAPRGVYDLRLHRSADAANFLPSASSRESGLRLGDWKTLADAVREHVGPEGGEVNVMLQEPWVPAIAALLESRLDEIAGLFGQTGDREST